MDTKVLLNLIDDLLREEGEKDINTKLQELINYIDQSRQASVDNAISINQAVSDITKICTSSFTNQLTRSYTKIFTSIDGHQHFGDNFSDKLKDIFSDNQYNLPNIVSEIQKLITERKDFIIRIQSISDNLTKLGIEAHFFTSDIYEIGVIIPDKKDLHLATTIEKQIHNWNFTFKIISEVTGHEVGETKIDRVAEALRFKDTLTANK